MPRIRNSRTVPFAARDVYGAFMDLEAYPSILNYIEAVEILEQNAHQMRVKLMVNIRILRFAYTCALDLDPDKRITIRAVDGPFRHLNAEITFIPVDRHTTTIHYTFDSRFRARWMEAAANLLFVPQFNYSLNAFEKYLAKIYKN